MSNLQVCAIFLVRVSLLGLTGALTGLAGIAVGDESDPNRKPDVVKVAAVQLIGYDKSDLPREGYDPAVTMLPYIARAASDGAQLVVFPEYVLGRTPVPGSLTNKIAREAAEHAIYVIAGCWEVFDDQSYANTALIFDRQGKIMGKYRKTHAAVDQYDGEPAWTHAPRDKDVDWFIRNDPEWVMQRGTDLPVFEFDFGRVGILTCYDGWFPESFRVLSLNGAELIVWINGRGGVVEDFIMKSVMFQSHVGMVCTNQAYGGGTMIGDVPAKVLARCPDHEEAYISAEINLARIRNKRQSSRNFRQRRPDLYGPLILGAGSIKPTAAGTQLPALSTFQSTSPSTSVAR
ncbi:MAG: carbon-nitrogen hydrolase family protein [Planctomycetota bacterium]